MQFLTEIEERFQSIGITPSDCEFLSRLIVQSDEYGELMPAIHMFGYSCEMNNEVLKVCDHFMKDEMTPGLTAVCMKISIEHWCLWSQYMDVIEKFVDLSIYEEWYDEVIFAISFVNRNRDIQFTREIEARLQAAVNHPRIKRMVPL